MNQFISIFVLIQVCYLNLLIQKNKINNENKHFKVSAFLLLQKI